MNTARENEGRPRERRRPIIWPTRFRSFYFEIERVRIIILPLGLIFVGEINE